MSKKVKVLNNKELTKKLEERIKSLEDLKLKNL